MLVCKTVQVISVTMQKYKGADIMVTFIGLVLLSST